MLNSSLLLIRGYIFNIISMKKDLKFSDLIILLNSRAEIHQIYALVFWNI